MNNCLHIAQAQDGTLTGWADDIQVPGRMHYANGLRPPERIVENYGEIAKVSARGLARIEVELRAYIAMCCSHRFAATLSSDGSSLIGEWPAGTQSNTATGQVGASARKHLSADRKSVLMCSPESVKGMALPFCRQDDWNSTFSKRDYQQSQRCASRMCAAVVTEQARRPRRGLPVREVELHLFMALGVLLSPQF